MTRAQVDARHYTADELERIHKEQVDAMVPLVLEVWRQGAQEERKDGDRLANHPA